MQFLEDREKRGYIGSALIFMLIVGVLVFLAFVEIPANNNDTVKIIIGMMVGSLSVTMLTLAGKNPEEVEELKRHNERLEAQNTQLKERVDHLEELLIQLQSEVIDKISHLTK